LLTVGLLVVRTSDFDVWYQSERAKGRWPSQRSKLKINGRPTKQTDRLRNAVLALVHDHKWSGKDPISVLHRMLVASGYSEAPSQKADCACVATSKCPATWLTSADRDKRKLLKIAGGCTIIYLLDGASLRSPHEDAGGIQ
jgi:hypothetical protein